MLTSHRGFIFLAAWLLSGGESYGSLYNINEEFLHLKNDLPRKTIEDVVVKQNEMIEVIAAYQDVHDRLPTETFDPFLAASLTSKQPKKTYGEEHFDVHSDVVFVGFPASAVEAIRSKWFEPLTHTDPFLATIGSHANVVVSPGHINVRHHFHLTQISFHVADSLRDYVSELLLHPTNDDDDLHYINAWEFEEVLDSLASTITATHTVNTGDAAKTFSISSTDTLFVINLDMASTRGADVPYAYRNGFTTGDLRAMANEADVLRAAEAVLNIRRSTRVDLLAEDKTPLFTSIDKDGPLDDKYKERTRSNDVMNNQVHWRDAVSSTRDWAKNLSETIKSFAKDDKFTLKARMLRILNAPSDTSLARHTRSLASAIVSHARRLMTDAEMKDEERVCSHCSTSTWVGGNRLMWRDLHASSTPPAHRSVGNSPNEPQPRPLKEEEWLRIGTIVASKAKTHDKKRDYVDEIEHALNAMQRQLTSLEHLIWQGNCPDFNTPVISLGPISTIKDKQPDAHLDDLGELLADRVASRTVSPSCAVLAMQVALLETLRRSSLEMGAMSSRWLDSAQGDELKWYINDFAQLHARVLSLALEIANPLLASAISSSPFATNGIDKEKSKENDDEVAKEGTQIHAGKLSEEAAVYLGHLTSYVLRTVRYRVAPPMALRIDPAIDPTVAFAPIDLTPITEGLRQRVEKYQRRLIQDRIRYGERVHGDGYGEEIRGESLISRSAHAYTGESLLELILSDGLYRTREGSASGIIARNEQQGEENERELLLWSTLLPSVLFPTKIDVMLYVVKLQGSYDPLGKSIGDELGFDYATFMSEIGRLKLPNQQMSMSIQILDKTTLAGEKGIGLGLASCRREGRVPSVSGLDSEIAYYQFLDAACVWAHLHPVDQQSTPAQTFDKKLSTQTMHLPVFLISTAGEEPTFLANLQKASVVGDMVLIVQNQQEKVLSELVCINNQGTKDGSRPTDRRETSGRNPLASALAAVAQAIGGMPGGESGHRGMPTAPNVASAINGRLTGNSGTDNQGLNDDDEYTGRDLHDWSSFLGESPVFEAFALSSHYLPRFSSLEIESMHRSRLIRSLSLSRAISRMITDSTIGELSDKIEEGLERFQRILTQALAAGDVSDWSSAASAANTAYRLNQEMLTYHQAHVHDLVVTAATSPVDHHNNTYLIKQIHANTIQSNPQILNNNGKRDSFGWFFIKSSFWVIPFGCGCYYFVSLMMGKSSTSEPHRRY